MSTKIRRMLAGPLFVAFVAGGAVSLGATPAGALDSNNDTTTTNVCTEGTYGKDRWGNIYRCIGGKWVLWSMPARTLTSGATATRSLG